MTTTTATTSKTLSAAYLRLSDHIHNLLDVGDEQQLEQAVRDRQQLLVTITDWINGSSQ